MRTPYPNELRITNRETYSNELMHYGILGMKWGVRRYQNADGTLTEAGKKRYGQLQEKTKMAFQNKATQNLFSQFKITIPKEQQNRKMELAKAYGAYDMTFLEVVSDEALKAGNEKLLTEYAKYLEDPIAYAMPAVRNKDPYTTSIRG